MKKNNNDNKKKFLSDLIKERKNSPKVKKELKNKKNCYKNKKK